MRRFRGVTKKKCPAGWCPPIAAHAVCYKNKGGAKHYHATANKNQVNIILENRNL